MENYGPDVDPETIRAQMQHSYEALRSGITLAVQICGFLIAADAVLLGYGLSQRLAGVLLAASAMPTLMALIAWLTIAHGTPLVYIAVKAEHALAPNAPTLCATYATVHGPAFLRRMTESIREAEQEGRPPVDLRKVVSLRAAGLHRSFGVVIPSLSAICHGLLFIAALTVFDYRFL